MGSKGIFGSTPAHHLGAKSKIHEPIFKECLEPFALSSQTRLQKKHDKYEKQVTQKGRFGEDVSSRLQGNEQGILLKALEYSQERTRNGAHAGPIFQYGSNKNE